MAAQLPLLIAFGLLFGTGNGDPATPVLRPQPFAITVVDSETGRGVPLVELTTTYGLTFITDSAGRIAVDEPELMGTRVHFSIRSHGYSFPADGFGIRGSALEIVSGGAARIAVMRTNLAERLYRVTGFGIYRDSVLLGEPVPVEHPLRNGLVTGQDSILVVDYRGQRYWFWGDTGWPAYPLGNFGMSGAVTPPPGPELDLEHGPNLRYFVDDRGFSRKMVPLEEPGAVWAGPFMVVRDPKGQPGLFTPFSRMRSLAERLELGLLRYDDQREIFERVATWDQKMPAAPTGHVLRLAGPQPDSEQHFYFTTPFPGLRVPATWEAVQNPAAYEGLTCFAAGARYDETAPAEERTLPPVERDPTGSANLVWRPNTVPLTVKLQQQLVEAGTLHPAERAFVLRDVETGREITTHGGTVRYNAYRQRWVMVALEMGGTSLLGEVWFAEADTPLGPWAYTRKIVSHDDYSFYNVMHHPGCDSADGRRIYFEGTYTAMFSGAKTPTPRYDYNQVMYALALDDPRLVLPIPIYAESLPDGSVRYHERASVCRGVTGTLRVALFVLPPTASVPEGVLLYAAPLEPGRTAERLTLDENVDGARPLGVVAPLRPAADRRPARRYWHLRLAGLESVGGTYTVWLAHPDSNIAEATNSVSPVGRQPRTRVEQEHWVHDEVRLILAVEGARFALTGTFHEGRISGEWQGLTAGGAPGGTRGRWDAEPAMEPLHRTLRGGLHETVLPGGADTADPQRVRTWENPYGERVWPAEWFLLREVGGPE